MTDIATLQPLIAKSRALYRSPYLVENFINKDQIDQILKLHDSLPILQDGSSHQATRKDYLMFDKNITIIRDLFLPKLRDLFPDSDIVIDGGNFTTWHSPIKIHTDGYQRKYKSINDIVDEKSVLGFAVLVPLMTDTKKGTPKTVFFDQTLFDEALVGNWQLQEKNMPSRIDNFTYQDFDITNPDFEHINYHDPTHLKGFSINRVLEWRLGTAMIWHRAQFHCAAKFKEYNSKTHLIFLINVKE
jgi:hypothetical protein